jgi:hypothetical protein
MLVRPDDSAVDQLDREVARTACNLRHMNMCAQF